jgi:hypothetical protein
MNKLLNFYNAYEKQVILVTGLIIGLIIGLFLAWVVWPTRYTNATPNMLRSDWRDNYLAWVAEEYAESGDLEEAQDRLGVQYWKKKDPVELLEEAAEERGGVEGQQMATLAQALADAPAPDRPSLLQRLRPAFLVCGVGLLVAALAVLVYFGARRFLSGGEGISERATASRMMEPAAWDTEETTPLAQFVTTYTLGDDFYDPSFSIENADGDFLGECGVGIAEDIGVADPKKVTALEVWLFDKNDIRTVTTVVMSEHAFEDGTLSTSLEAKGDLALAQEGGEITLDTATLTLKAHILELEYGTGQLPPNSFFKRIMLELGVWVKPGSEDFAGPDFPSPTAL